MKNDEELRHLQLTELLIAKEVKRICEKHRIRYYMVGGTLLGSVRHGGFIPWDDDIDFAMARSDYDYFCDVCKTELHEPFVLQTWDTDENYPFSYGKVRLKNTLIEEPFVSGILPAENGIFIDIFPYDNIPDQKLKKLIHKAGWFFYNRALWMKKGYGRTIKEEGIKQKAKYIFASAIIRLLPYNYIKQRFNKLLRRYNNSETSCLAFDGVYSYEKNSIRREWMAPEKQYQFEDTEFMSFSDYDAYLCHMFGDYMKLPPVSQRHSHDIKKVVFGDY